MAKLAWLLVLAVIAVGCGSSSAKTTGPATLGPGQIVYQGTEWAVVIDGGTATVQHLVGDTWKPAARGTVQIRILGPKPDSTGNPQIPQVAAALSAGSDLAESALWVDGAELLEKGGGLTPTKGTIYGAPATALTPGKHTAIAYARTATNALAIAWTFSV